MSKDQNTINTPEYHNSSITLPASDVSALCTQILEWFHSLPNNPYALLSSTYSSGTEERINKASGLLAGITDNIQDPELLETIKEGMGEASAKVRDRDSDENYILKQVEGHPLFCMFVLTECPNYFLVRKLQDATSMTAEMGFLGSSVISLSIEDAANFMHETRMLKLDQVSQIHNSEEV